MTIRTLRVVQTQDARNRLAEMAISSDGFEDSIGIARACAATVEHGIAECGG